VARRRAGQGVRKGVSASVTAIKKGGTPDLEGNSALAFLGMTMYEDGAIKGVSASKSWRSKKAELAI
jgi:hypothetical protein